MNGSGNKKQPKLAKLITVAVGIVVLSIIIALTIDALHKKSIDVNIQNELSQARRQAELYVDANGRSYLNLCYGSAVEGVVSLQPTLDSLTNKYGLTHNFNERAGGPGLVTCNDTVNEWAVEAPLQKENTFFCVDFRGRATTTRGSTLDAYDTRCE